MKRRRALVSSAPNRNLRNELLEAMSRERFVKGQRLASIRDISRRYQVSKAVAERAVRGLITDGICYAEHGRGVFLAQDSAELRVSRTIGYVFGGIDYPRTANPFFSRVYEGTEAWIGEHGHNTVQFFNWQNKAKSVKAREWADFVEKLSGIFVIGVYRDEDFILMRNSGLPVVVTDYDALTLGMDCVVMDNVESMRQVTTRLLRRQPGGAILALLARRDERNDPAPVERRAAFLEVATAGARDPAAAVVMELDWSQADLDQLAERMQADDRRTARASALILEDDFRVPTVTRALAERGLACGVDYHLGYIGGMLDPAELAAYPAIAARYDIRRIGREAAVLLEERMQSGLGRPRRTVVTAVVEEDPGQPQRAAR